MTISAMASRRPTDCEVIERAIEVCRAHQACTAQVLWQRLEPVREHLANESVAAECGVGDRAVIEDTLVWLSGIGTLPTPALKNGLSAIRERLTQRARYQSVTPTNHVAA